MRPFGRVVALSALAMFVVACDTNQPANVDQATATLEYAVISDIFAAVVYPELRVDTNNDGVPDSVIPALNEFAAPPVCEVDGNRPLRSTIPWPLGFEALVVPAGSTNATVIDTTRTGTGGYTFDRFTAFEDSGSSLPDRLIDPPVRVSLGRVAHAYTGGTDTTTGSRVYLVSCQSVGDETLIPYRNTTFQIRRGDLIRFQARRAVNGPVAANPSEFRVTLLIDGVPVEVTGTAVADDPETGVAFTYLFN